MKNKGQNLVEIIIIIALVSLVSVFAFSLLGGNINDILSVSNTKFKEFNPFGTNTADDTETSPSPTAIPSAPTGPASIDNPIRDCTDSMCSIDYGSIVMTGIPEDFSEFIETAGPAAGSDTINSILDSIIELAEKGEIDVDLAALKVLSDKGHTLADREKGVETFLNESLSFGSTLNEFQLEEHSMIAGHEFADFEAALASFKSSTTPMDPEIKKLVADLGNEINIIFEDFDVNFQTIVEAQNEAGLFSPDEYNNVLSPKPSVMTDLDSAIICNVGNYTDTGHECN